MAWKILRAGSGHSSHVTGRTSASMYTTPAHAVGVAPRPVEAERRAPVVHDQHHAVADAERLEPASR